MRMGKMLTDETFFIKSLSFSLEISNLVAPGSLILGYVTNALHKKRLAPSFGTTLPVSHSHVMITWIKSASPKSTLCSPLTPGLTAASII